MITSIQESTRRFNLERWINPTNLIKKDSTFQISSQGKRRGASYPTITYPPRETKPSKLLFIAIITLRPRLDTWRRETKRLSPQRSLPSARESRLPKRIFKRFYEQKYASTYPRAKGEPPRTSRAKMENLSTSNLRGQNLSKQILGQKLYEQRKSLSVFTDTNSRA
jgi:hypothetical protein